MRITLQIIGPVILTALAFSLGWFALTVGT
jgi:hypothetical protein